MGQKIITPAETTLTGDFSLVKEVQEWDGKTVHCYSLTPVKGKYSYFFYRYEGKADWCVTCKDGRRTLPTMGGVHFYPNLGEMCAARKVFAGVAQIIAQEYAK
jgi:hypothetical protein